MCGGLACNQWPDNPYDVVTAYGVLDDGIPWQDPFGAQFIGNRLRDCNFVGLTIKWFTPNAPVPDCPTKHVVTAWGDDGPNNTDPLPDNPTQLKITDSDSFNDNVNGDVQTYTYDLYSQSPRPDGWYFDYLLAQHPYIDTVAILSQSAIDTCTGATVYATGTLRIKNSPLLEASGLHYDVGVRDSNHICGYTTTVRVDGQSNDVADKPQIVMYHRSSKHHHLTVDCEFQPGEVPADAEVTITTRFELPRDNMVYYDDVKFMYGDPPVAGPTIPKFEWIIVTPGYPTPGANRAFVIGSFDLFQDAVSQTPVAKYRLQHEYDYDAPDPNNHHFELTSLEMGRTFYVGNLMFGYSASPVDDLWAFGAWTHADSGSVRRPFGTGCTVTADLHGLNPEDWSLSELCIPTISQWGLVMMCLLLVAAGALAICRRRAAT